MNIRVAIKKEMRKGGGEYVGEKEERVEEGGSGMLAMLIDPALERDTESVGPIIQGFNYSIISQGYIFRSCLKIKGEWRGAQTESLRPAIVLTLGWKPHDTIH